MDITYVLQDFVWVCLSGIKNEENVIYVCGVKCKSSVVH
jgi:hypothetical protein